ncbi:MAG: hypothetical protein J6U46_01160 [Bacteroidaceae bacterium]|nr:hypothetical protein [Bacteroidaceae bacterium]
MKKIYKSPATEIYKVNLRDGILMNASQVGDPYSSDDIDPNAGSGSEGGDPGDDDLSRDNNGGNIWDNAW